MNVRRPELFDIIWLLGRYKLTDEGLALKFSMLRHFIVAVIQLGQVTWLVHFGVSTMLSNVTHPKLISFEAWLGFFPSMFFSVA